MHIDRRNSARAHSCQVRAANSAAVVGTGHTVRCRWKLAVVVRTMDHRISETAATPSIDGVDSLCPGKTLLPGCRPGRGDAGQKNVAKTPQNAR